MGKSSQRLAIAVAVTISLGYPAIGMAMIIKSGHPWVVAVTLIGVVTTETAVLKERLRISRDLHDGLGRSLTAIALKGDLARRLLDHDPTAVDGELTELVQVAREAAQDVRQVARGYREMSLAQEVNRAVALLEASGVACQTHLADIDLPRGADEALAWAIREGVTNVVRHSRATTCSISTSQGKRSGKRTVCLELVNDGVPGSGTTGHQATGTGSVGGETAGSGRAGSGLTGLGERAEQLGGTVTTERSPGAFRLRVEIPLSSAVASRKVAAR